MSDLDLSGVRTGAELADAINNLADAIRELAARLPKER